MIWYEALFQQYRGKRLLDANLLLLFLIGTLDRTLIARFKRTAGFSEDDFDVLLNFVPLFRILITTPQLLTEVSSLANALPESLKPIWNRHLMQHAEQVLEVAKPSIELMRQPAFLAFGLGDASIFATAQNTLILTDDFRLSGLLRSRDLAVINLRDILPVASSNRPSRNPR